MLTQTYRQYIIEALPKLMADNRYSVAVRITQQNENKAVVYEANGQSSYSLQIEAEKECINFGKSLVDANMIAFARRIGTNR
jgi:hypothetical protein